MCSASQGAGNKEAKRSAFYPLLVCGEEAEAANCI